MQCPGCRREHPASQKFCGECGQALARPHPGDPATTTTPREVERLAQTLREARQQQTATNEILRVISSSPTDARPVFDAIVASALRLCDAVDCGVFRLESDLVHLVAHNHESPETLRALARAWPTPVQNPVSPICRAIQGRTIVHLSDTENDPTVPESMRERTRAVHVRSMLVVPLLRNNVAAGAIRVSRREPTPFSDAQIELLKTFADQAVIAVENVRLFKELEASNRELTDSLTQQTATAEILRVISRSPTDIQPVLDAVSENAARLCEAYDAVIYRVVGDRLILAAHHGPISVGRVGEMWLPLTPGTANGRAILEARLVHVADQQVDGDDFPEGREFARQHGYRTMLAVPLIRDGVAIGTIGLRRTEVQLFTERQVALLQTFSDQAVIAIENVRLFTELQGKNRALTEAHAQVTEALEQQTATSEILRVISRSQTDVQPVFDTIVRNAVRLCNGLFSTVFQFDGELLHIVATHNLSAAGREALHRVYPARPTRALAAGRAILDRAVVHIADVELEPESPQRAVARAVGWRSALIVPMMREGAPIGVVTVGRVESGPFPDSEIELLKTFADQAVIAVENVRLFNELQARTGELTRSVEKLTALGEVSRAVSSTLDVETVLDTIVSRASQLAGAAGCSIFEYDAVAEQFALRATHNDDVAFVEALRAVPLRKREGLMGRAAEMREPVQIPDIAQPGAYRSSMRDTLLRFGYRALLAVPLLREDQIIGSLSFTRREPGEFSPEVVDVLKTFATQSALAIQNARLFREIADKSRQLETASRHKSEFLANMSHELRTPLNAIIGFSEVLAERMFGEINDKQAEYLQDILESGRHLLSLINDILDLSKIEAGHMGLEPADYHLPGLIENALILVRERASRRGITLGRTLDERLGIVHGDERKVKQVLLNLLSNALKFTPEGGRVDVAAVLHDAMAQVSVTDTGVGIAPADQEAVFEEFRQVGAAEKKAEGTGLGLALSRKFVELHGGTIWVESEPGRGSTFTFTLPLSV